MLTYRATLKPAGATRSPWQADTLFGHLCWLLRYREGEAALAEFLQRYQAEPPLLFSNGFPGDFLPRPLLPAPPVKSGQPKREQVQMMQEAKAGRGVRWVSPAQFEAMRRGERISLGPQPDPLRRRTVLKNQINRLTFGATSLEEDGGGNLYNVDELAFVHEEAAQRSGLEVSVYVRAADETWAGRAKSWLGELAHSGYGAKKSAGYGQFALLDWQPFTAFDDAPPGANGFISLSNWTPAPGDPTAGFYGRLVKYGKLGEEWATSSQPFKFPLIMLTAGSSFYTTIPPRAWYGRLVDGLDPTEQRPIVQYGLALAVPARLEIY